ncbi:MAG: hypothetical protein EA425_07740, partial [Puniceicoccaceae bacterium]
MNSKFSSIAIFVSALLLRPALLAAFFLVMGVHSSTATPVGVVRVLGSLPGGVPVPYEALDVVQVAASSSHSLALRADGTVVAWGHNNFNQSTVPEDLSGVVQVAAGGVRSLALLADGKRSFPTSTAWRMPVVEW